MKIWESMYKTAMPLDPALYTTLNGHDPSSSSAYRLPVAAPTNNMQWIRKWSPINRDLLATCDSQTTQKNSEPNSRNQNTTDTSRNNHTHALTAENQTQPINNPKVSPKTMVATIGCFFLRCAVNHDWLAYHHNCFACWSVANLYGSVFDSSRITFLH